MAQKCVSVDDGRRYRRSEKEETDTKKKEKKEEKPKPQTYQPQKHNYKPYHTFNRLYRYNQERRENNFTPLNQSRTNVLMWIRDNQTPYNRPRLMTQRSRNTNRFYKFHDDYGHDTEDCFELKREIERLIEIGALRKFTTPPKESQPNTIKEVPPVANPKTKAVLGRIHVITGGESFSTGTKKRSRAEIMHINSTKHAKKT